MGSCRRPNEHAPSGDCRTHIHSTPWAVEGNNTPTEHLNVQQLFSTRTMGARVPNSLSSQCRAAHLRLQELNAAHLENDTFFFRSGKVTEILSLHDLSLLHQQSIWRRHGCQPSFSKSNAITQVATGEGLSFATCVAPGPVKGPIESGVHSGSRPAEMIQRKGAWSSP